MKKKLRKLWGFRSNTPWKKLLAVVYYAACAAVLWFCFSTPLPIEAGSYDLAIFRLSAVIIFLWLLSPAIFLSETPLRKYLPLFRDHIGSRTLMGMMIVFLLFTYLFAAVDDLHTQTYKDDYASYYEALYEAYEATQSTEAE